MWDVCDGNVIRFSPTFFVLKTTTIVTWEIYDHQELISVYFPFTCCLHMFALLQWNENSMWKTSTQSSCLRLHGHGRFRFTTFNVIAFKMFTSEDVEVGDWNTLCVDVKQYKLPLSLMWNNQIYYFWCNLGKHKGITIMTCLCTKLVIVLNHRNIIIVHAIGLQ